MKKTLSILMVLLLAFSSLGLSFADKPDFADDKTRGNSDKIKLEKLVDDEDVALDLEENEDGDEEDESEEGNRGRGNRFKDNRKLKDDEDLLEDELEALEESDPESEEVQSLKDQIKSLRKEAIDIRNELRKEIRNGYTEEDLANIEALRERLQTMDGEVKVLGVDSILSNFTNFKFDMPPVIKSGRTLIPVRAITEGLGAEVAWDGTENKVTITKDGIVIELWLDNQTAVVNGEEVLLDTNPEIMNSRTMVPLRFISETLNLGIEWNEDDETIELTDDEDGDDETPADEDPADETPADEDPADETPADEDPADETPADEDSAE